MPRRAVDPVERAFAAWVSLDGDEKQRFADRCTGYSAAIGPEYLPPKPRRKRKEVAAGGEQ